MRVLNAKTEIDGLRVRCHAAPMFFCHPTLDWQRIADHVTVTRDAATGAYTVAAMGESIIFAPMDIPAGKIKRTVATWRHLGDVLTDADGLDSVSYRVSWSPGANPRRDRLGFDIAGTGLGLFFDDWIGRFGPARIAVAIAGQTVPLTAIIDGSAEMPEAIPGNAVDVSVDLTGIEPDEFGEVNLDPSVAADLTGGSGILRSATEATWLAARNAASAASMITEPDDLWYSFIGTDGGSFRVRRAVFAFDLSAVAGDIESASITLSANGFDADNQAVIGCVDPPAGGVLALSDYSKPYLCTPSRATIDDYDLVTVPLTLDATPGDLLAVMVRQALDVDYPTTPPSPQQSWNAIEMATAPPVLELELTDGSRRTLTLAGR